MATLDLYDKKYYHYGDAYKSYWINPVVQRSIQLHKDYPITILEEDNMEKSDSQAINKIFDDLEAPVSKVGDLSDQLEQITSSFSKAFSSGIPKMQIQTALQEISTMISVKTHIQSLVNKPGLVKPDSVQKDEFIVQKDENKKLLNLLKRLDYEIMSKLLNLLSLFESIDDTK
jgi:hypothetical protein